MTKPGQSPNISNPSGDESDSDGSFEAELFQELAALEEQDKNDAPSDDDGEPSDTGSAQQPTFKCVNGDSLPDNYTKLEVRRQGQLFESLDNAKKNPAPPYDQHAIVTAEVDGKSTVFRAHHVVAVDDNDSDTEIFYLITDPDQAEKLSRSMANGNKGYFSKGKAQKIANADFSGIKFDQLLMDTPTAEAILSANKKRKRKLNEGGEPASKQPKAQQKQPKSNETPPPSQKQAQLSKTTTKIPGSPLRTNKGKTPKSAPTVHLTPPVSPRKQKLPVKPAESSSAPSTPVKAKSSFTLQITTASKAELQRVVDALN